MLKPSDSALEKRLQALPTAASASGHDGVHIPKCPTCGSPDIARIILASKGLAAITFGLLSVGYAGKTFECNNCHLKW